MKGVELLSPCGSREGLEAALRFGADAVYLGGRMLQMRSASAGFTKEAMGSAIARAHALGAKVYVTVNSLLFSREIELLGDYGRELSELGADAAIVSDVGAIAILKKACPSLPLHLSTQSSVLNYAAARVYHDMGVDRIVLARELSIEDIGELRAKTPQSLTLEAFVHGAMCMAYSGRCLMSSFILGRSANRGQCAQPCRWAYKLMEEKRPGEYFPVEEENGYSMILSSRDLCMVEHLNELREAGISSFKIEGRMKSEYYTAAVTNAYRLAIEEKTPLSLCREELNRVSHRPYTTGFYFGELPADTFNSGLYQQDWVYCGEVLAFENGVALVRQRNHFQPGDILYPLSPGAPDRPFAVTDMWDEEGEPLLAASHATMLLKLSCPFPLSPGDFLRRPAR